MSGPTLPMGWPEGEGSPGRVSRIRAGDSGRYAAVVPPSSMGDEPTELPECSAATGVRGTTAPKRAVAIAIRMARNRRVAHRVIGRERIDITWPVSQVGVASGPQAGPQAGRAGSGDLAKSVDVARSSVDPKSHPTGNGTGAIASGSDGRRCDPGPEAEVLTSRPLAGWLAVALVFGTSAAVLVLEILGRSTARALRRREPRDLHRHHRHDPRGDRGGGVGRWGGRGPRRPPAVAPRPARARRCAGDRHHSDRARPRRKRRLGGRFPDPRAHGLRVPADGGPCSAPCRPR